MPKLRKASVTANELFDSDVTAISIVKRGAIQAPFKIVKSHKTEDDPMNLNLIKLIKAKAEADMATAVISFVVAKGADIDNVKERLKAAGFDVDKPIEQEGLTVFPQEEATDGIPTAVFKIDDTVSAIIEGHAIGKAFSPANFESTNFQEMMSQEGFFPTVRSATDVLGFTIENSLQKAESGSAARSDVKKAINDFGTFVDGLLKSVPEKAFKIEKSEDTPQGEVTAAADGGTAGTGEENTGAGADDAAEGEGGESGTGNEGAGSDGEVVLKTVTDMIEALGNKVTEQVGAIAKSVKAVKSDVANLGERVGKATEEAKKAIEVAKSVVTGDPVEDPEEPVIKSSGGRVPPPIDTAYGRPS